jgi:UDP-glucose 4-epimerase
MKPSVLLTGGLGYVGGRIALGLAADDYALTCGTRRTNAPAWLPVRSVAHIDWNSPDSLASACRDIDCVIHLAAMNEIDAAKDPVGALQVNGVASLRLLEAARQAGVRRFVYFSTAHVYGAALQGTVDETTPSRPIHPYAITHKVTEDFVLAAHDQKQIEGVVFRMSNGFGAPVTPNIDRWTLLVNDLCRQAATRGELRLNSSGTQLRDFITLSDVVRAVSHVLRLDASQLDNGLFNLGSGESVSILEMAERVAARWKILTRREIRIVRPESESNSLPTLDYSCEKLAATGFVLTSEADREIDDTLKLCIQAFGN